MGSERLVRGRRPDDDRAGEQAAPRRGLSDGRLQRRAGNRVTAAALQARPDGVPQGAHDGVGSPRSNSWRRGLEVPDLAPALPRLAAAPRQGLEVVQRLSAKSTDPGDWDTLKEASVSSGVTGVIFATANDGSKVVVKGLAEAPQRAMFAQEMMEYVGVAATQTNAIPVSGKLGRHILQRLDELATRMGPPDGPSVATKVNAFRGGKALLLMEQKQVKNLQQLATGSLPTIVGGARSLPGWWRNLLESPDLWSDFGKIFFVDQFLGNEDRFESLKLQNVFVDPSTRRAVALDNDTMAPIYIRSITNVDTSAGVAQRDVVNKTPQDFIRFTIEGGWAYQFTNTQVQERAMASVEQVAGTKTQVTALVGQKVNQLLGALDPGPAAATPNDQAIHGAVQGILGNPQKLQMVITSMDMGVAFARNQIRALWEVASSKKRKAKTKFGQRWRAHVDRDSSEFRHEDDTMFNGLVFVIRWDYLEERAQGANHAAALATVQQRHGAKVAKQAQDKIGTHSATGSTIAKA